MLFPISSGDEKSGPVRSQRLRRGAPRSFAVFIGVSVAAHAAVLVLLPPLTRAPERPGAKSLEVTILQPEPLPVAIPESEPARPRHRAERPRKPAGNTLNVQAGSRAPAIALSNPEPKPETSFAIPSSTSSGLPPPAPGAKPRMAGTAALPPVSNAAFLSNAAPRYPQASRRAGEQGTVTLRVLVTAEGLPGRVDLEQSSGSAHLDNAAVETARGWRFSPARRGGEPVESWMLVPVVFRLEGSS